MTKNLTNKINTDFTTNRRIYIVRNQNLFYMEPTKNSRFIKEKPIELQLGAFNRIGNMTIISAKKNNSEIKFLINEYSIVKILNYKSKRTCFLINLHLIDNAYNFKITMLEDSLLQNKKNLFNPKFSGSNEDPACLLNSADIFFQKLTDMLEDQNLSNQINQKDKVWKKELLGEFLGLFSFDVKRWLKSSIIIDEDDHQEKVEYPSFREFFYSENIDELNPFDRLDKITEIYSKLRPKIQGVIQEFRAKDDMEKMKNPKEKSFGTSIRRIKSNKKKTEYLGHLGFGPEEIIPENVNNLNFENSKYSKIQSLELENKLKSEYWAHKKRPCKVMVAPSPIHRYGLFATEK